MQQRVGDHGRDGTVVVGTRRVPDRVGDAGRLVARRDHDRDPGRGVADPQRWLAIEQQRRSEERHEESREERQQRDDDPCADIADGLTELVLPRQRQRDRGAEPRERGDDGDGELDRDRYVDAVTLLTTVPPGRRPGWSEADRWVGGRRALDATRRTLGREFRRGGRGVSVGRFDVGPRRARRATVRRRERTPDPGFGGWHPLLSAAGATTLRPIDRRPRPRRCAKIARGDAGIGPRNPVRTFPGRCGRGGRQPREERAMSEWPSGTVTFVFTDLEDSTRLWDEHPDEMRTALARHDAILHDAVAAHDGMVVKSTGDGAYAVFGNAGDAVRAASAFVATL